MKQILAVGSVIAVFASSAWAGSFGGPAPFRNESPLPSGTDGTYQAVASGTNLTGLFSFQISGGMQTNPGAAGSQYVNSWIFFVDGQILNGQTYANVSEDKVAGVLDSASSTSIPTNEDGSVTLPVVIAIPGDSASGSFSGKMDLKSPVAAFSGNGIVQGTPPRVDQIVFIRNLPDNVILIENANFDPVTVVPVNVPGSSIADAEFSFRGTRLTTVVSQSGTGGNTATVAN